MDKETHARVALLQNAMREAEIELVVLTPGTNLRYLVNADLMNDERLWALVVPAQGEPFAFSNRVYCEETSGAFDDWEKVWWEDGEEPYPLLKNAVEARRLAHRVVGVDGTMRGGFLLALQDVFSSSRFVAADLLFSALRIQKRPEELARIRQACRRSQNALEEVMRAGRAWLGKREGDFAHALMDALRRQGIQNPGGLVCAGRNAAMPHYREQGGVIEDNSCLLVDFGGTYEGYWSDMTRTFVFGNPGDVFFNAYDTVETAKKRACQAAVPGATCEAIDGAARRVIEQAGYGAYFTHRTGHGTGLDVHEKPYLSQGCKETIGEGMVFSIEPGIYIPGKFGIRLENQVIVTQSGVEELQDYPPRPIVSR